MTWTDWGKHVKHWQTEKLVYFSCEPVYKWLFIWPQMVCSVREPNRNHKDRLIYFFVWSYWKRSIMETKLSPKPVILWFLSAWIWRWNKYAFGNGPRSADCNIQISWKIIRDTLLIQAQVSGMSTLSLWRKLCQSWMNNRKYHVQGISVKIPNKVTVIHPERWNIVILDQNHKLGHAVISQNDHLNGGSTPIRLQKSVC